MGHTARRQAKQIQNAVEEPLTYQGLQCTYQKLWYELREKPTAEGTRWSVIGLEQDKSWTTVLANLFYQNKPQKEIDVLLWLQNTKFSSQIPILTPIMGRTRQ